MNSHISPPSISPNSIFYDGFEAVIGLEIHAQILTTTKIFSPAPSTFFGQPANTCASFIDLAFPGMLPVFNGTCADQAIRLGLALGGDVRLTSVFERKHYFYPDNPAGYQITQYRHPIIENGCLVIRNHQGEDKPIRLQRIHLEQDAGKSMHDQDPHLSYLDFNRVGVGLMEIVSHPDLNTPEEVVSYVKKMRSLVRALGVCGGDMEKGHLRVDANISVHRPGTPLGTRIELKNMNSTRFLHQALIHEIERQIQAIHQGETLVQETRTFDPSSGITRPLRSKENDTDYFYFPDPDLPPLVLTQEHVDDLAKNLPETPRAKYLRFMESFSLNPYDAELLSDEREVADFFEEGLKYLEDPNQGKILANWIIGELFAALNRHQVSFQECQMTPEYMAKLVNALARKELSGPLAKEVFSLMWETNQDPEKIMKEKGLVQILDKDQMHLWIDAVLDREEGQMKEYFSGKEKLLGYFVGQVMKESKGKANPQMIQDLIKEVLTKRREHIGS